MNESKDFKKNGTKNTETVEWIMEIQEIMNWKGKSNSWKKPFQVVVLLKGTITAFYRHMSELINVETPHLYNAAYSKMDSFIELSGKGVWCDGMIWRQSDIHLHYLPI